MTRDQLYTQLKNMLPAQLREVAFLYGVAEYLPQNVADTDIAMSLIRVAESRNDLSGLAEKVPVAVANQIDERLQHLHAGRGAVFPQLSCSLRNEAERQWVRSLLHWFRALPADQHLPEILDGLGRLELAAGDFAQAAALFGELADSVADTGAKATALYNRHRAALEQRDFPAALDFLLQAAALDAERFAPFPLRKYTPREILGAGGFGVAFLCHDQHFGCEVVIKTLCRAGLERDAGEIFREARLLKQLNHPAIIDVEYCDFADHAETRPYLVMAHFDGMTLEDYVAQHGVLAPEEALSLARCIAAAMQAAHARNILHRDLKPANILVRKENPPRP